MPEKHEQLRVFIISLLPKRPRQQDYRKLAEQLRTEAERLEKLANAQQRNPSLFSTITSRTGRPLGSGASFIRAEESKEGRSNRIHIGRRLWQQIGEPQRIDIQRIGNQFILRPCTGDVGYAITRPKDGMPRFSIGKSSFETLGLTGGYYDAQISDNAIVANLNTWRPK